MYGLFLLRILRDRAAHDRLHGFCMMIRRTGRGFSCRRRCHMALRTSGAGRYGCFPRGVGLFTICGRRCLRKCTGHLFGGGLFSTFAKHSKMDDAQRYMEQAKRDLAAFSRELADVSETLNINTGEFLTFADYFFDGFLADMMVQSKIRDAQRQVDDAIYRVESILSKLRTQE